MHQFADSLKGQVNTLNFFIVLLIGGFIFLLLKKRKMGISLFTLAIVFFMLTSTAYLPRYCVQRMEDRYAPFQISTWDANNEQTFIHVLGGGYTNDKRLPSQAMLSAVGLGRLAEGIRIHKAIPGSTIVCSGYMASGDESLAAVMRNAAIDLGVAPDAVDTLSSPHTTEQEAEALQDKFGNKIKLIVVTDAVHMPRAISFFENHGFEPFAAPTNFLIKKDDNPYGMPLWPSIENMSLMDRIFREFFAALKAKF